MPLGHSLASPLVIYIGITLSLQISENKYIKYQRMKY